MLTYLELMHLHDLLVNRQGLKARKGVHEVLNHRVGRALEHLVVLYGDSTHGSNLGWDVGGHSVGRRIVGLYNWGVVLHHVVGLSHRLRVLLGLHRGAHCCHLPSWISVWWNMRWGSHRDGRCDGLRGTCSARGSKGSRGLM